MTCKKELFITLLDLFFFLLTYVRSTYRICAQRRMICREIVLLELPIMSKKSNKSSSSSSSSSSSRIRVQYHYYLIFGLTFVSLLLLPSSVHGFSRDLSPSLTTRRYNSRHSTRNFNYLYNRKSMCKPTLSPTTTVVTNTSSRLPTASTTTRASRLQAMPTRGGWVLLARPRRISTVVLSVMAFTTLATIVLYYTSMSFRRTFIFWKGMIPIYLYVRCFIFIF